MGTRNTSSSLRSARDDFTSKGPVSQLVNAEVNGGNRNAVLASNYATRICGRHAPHAEMNCDLRGESIHLTAVMY